MNKLVALAILALAPLFALAAAPLQAISESVADGQGVRTRTLDSHGVLTESVCLSTSTASGSVGEHCVNRKTHLSKRAARDLVSQMSRVQSELAYQAVYRSNAKSTMNGASHSDAVGLMHSTSVAMAQSTNLGGNTEASFGAQESSSSSGVSESNAGALARWHASK